MKNFDGMSVTIKLTPCEFQSICEIIHKSEETNRNNQDEMKLNLNEKHFVSSVFKRLASSGRKKADRLEAIGAEVRNSMDFAYCKS